MLMRRGVRRRGSFAALLGLLCGLSPLAPQGALAMPESDLSDGRVRCRIEQNRQGSVLTLHGVVTSVVPASGTYQMRILKHGPAGSSQISQGGRFAADPRAQATLGDVSISLEASSSFEAQLVLEVDGQRIACAAVRSSTLDL
ncbi:curli-like amyloid fiber formation chaperone CsgH [Methylobacterium sp. NEAU 140]|uniref:curli-like amyloid fiber formation chaperone CsgH n=1 Tax=Methylobacterium sp. NEAU 140 TaxID=3064945 RepID=UPI002734245F|nr:curli-like amyloid fiber formation chaperone CsgH [Methylobacterium sp. NEAU 140]MDP4023760.1 curli-like amyloid fiber formation chaperone CsgH [Methylobacterium sp. NEAU 140]